MSGATFKILIANLSIHMTIIHLNLEHKLIFLKFCFSPYDLLFFNKFILLAQLNNIQRVEGIDVSFFLEFFCLNTKQKISPEKKN